VRREESGILLRGKRRTGDRATQQRPQENPAIVL
jgi:hypothetical protein